VVVLIVNVEDPAPAIEPGRKTAAAPEGDPLTRNVTPRSKPLAAPYFSQLKDVRQK
jgi:hypothetical protein